MRYAAHLGWLDSRCKGRKAQRSKELDDDVLLRPPADWLCHGIIDAFESAGKSKSTAMGIAPLDWVDIKAWAEMSKITDYWLCSTIRVMSISYANAIHEYNDAEFGHSPILEEYSSNDSVQKSLADTKIKSAMRILKAGIG